MAREQPRPNQRGRRSRCSLRCASPVAPTAAIAKPGQLENNGPADRRPDADVAMDVPGSIEALGLPLRGFPNAGDESGWFAYELGSGRNRQIAPPCRRCVHLCTRLADLRRLGRPSSGPPADLIVCRKRGGQRWGWISAVSAISSPNRAATSLSSSTFAALGAAVVSGTSCPALASNSFSSTPRSTKRS